jgi:hypothetical protein
MDLIDVLTRFVIPPVLGGAGGIITVWINWNVEQRRMRVQRRRELVDQWRNELLPIIAAEEPDRDALVRHPAYGSLRPHLSRDVISKIEKANLIIVQMEAIQNAYARMLTDEIGRIERKWKLV